ncbi:sulfide:quinone oxidoreductase, mitochondrial [Cydia pomonella]|uniref:sulfide:quinone oxidoreductase, mitochondrial n=1 Tax=Cydia pomonella TaxID=82600 RepID=UPI002ADE6B3D|nr:sulfide:quinone oxidoreductase, mitochondrial [Cydia pomonella]
MNSVTRSLRSKCFNSGWHRSFSVTAPDNATHSCKLLVVGGGSGGCTIAAKFARKLGKDAVIVLEPSCDHYYQPLWTLVGAGITSVASTRRSASSVLPIGARWLRDSAACVDPKKQEVTTESGDQIKYEYIVVAVGLQNDYDKVPGLSEALQRKDSGVSTIYSPDHCEKTWGDMRQFKGGEAIFTYPDTPIKCPGAPQKIAYLADSWFNKANVRSKTNITYNTCLPVIFGVKKYADVLLKVVERKNIKVNYTTVLKELNVDKKEGVFVSTKDKSKTFVQPYDMIHVTPPMKTPDFLQNNKDITDASGYLEVDKFTLQHTKFPNMYGIGDCINTPNSKTAAAIAKQCYVLEHNLLSTMAKDNPKQKYDGYGACPLVTSYNTCILAEFLYDGVVHETMPKCKLLIVGGGTGGCSVAWRFSNNLKNNEICVIDPAEFHYYQPLFPLVAAGIKEFDQSKKPLRSVLPPGVCCIKDYALHFDPCNQVVHTHGGDEIYYDFLVVAVGLINDYYKISGLKAALDDPCSCVTTIYSPEHCQKTWSAIQRTAGGHAIFTFPRDGAKCSGAAQKIMYLADDYFRKNKTRDLLSITYNTGSDAIFGVPKYAKALSRVASARAVAVNTCCELVEVTPKHAVFLDAYGMLITLPYNFLHVTPPMSPPTGLAQSQLADETGYLDVDPYTLQHRQFSSVYGLGDCTNTPNSKTAAAVACQSHVVEQNLWATMQGRQPSAKYDGYGACAMMTSYRTGILAEFRYDKQPYETFPFDQSKERKLFYYMKRDYFPYLYWNKIIKGKWNGPKKLPRLSNPFRKKK